MIYFKNISALGDLQLEKILFEFDKEPMLFVCLDKRKNRFLCLCIDNIFSQSWMITQVSSRLLIQLIEDQISIYQAFEKSNHKVLIAEKQGHDLICKEYSFCDIPQSELPDENEKLENAYLAEYLSM